MILLRKTIRRIWFFAARVFLTIWIYKSSRASTEYNIQSIGIYRSKLCQKDNYQYYRYVRFGFQDKHKHKVNDMILM